MKQNSRALSLEGRERASRPSASPGPKTKPYLAHPPGPIGKSEYINSIVVGFHVRSRPNDRDCGGAVTWYDSPRQSWLACAACFANTLLNQTVAYGAPVPAPPPNSAPTS